MQFIESFRGISKSGGFRYDLVPHEFMLTVKMRLNQILFYLKDTDSRAIEISRKNYISNKNK